MGKEEISFFRDIAHVFGLSFTQIITFDETKKCKNQEESY